MSQNYATFPHNDLKFIQQKLNFKIPTSTSNSLFTTNFAQTPEYILCLGRKTRILLLKKSNKPAHC